MEWKRVDKELPVIPEGKYGIRVLVCEYDSCYDEDDSFPPKSRGCGCTVREVHYGSIRNRDGVIPSSFDINLGEYQFMELCVGVFDDSDWIPLMDQVTHWDYLPEPPPYHAVHDVSKGVLRYIYIEDVEWNADRIMAREG